MMMNNNPMQVWYNSIPEPKTGASSLISLSFHGFPQLSDEDFDPEGAAEGCAYCRSPGGREEIQYYLPAVKKYVLKGEHVLVEAQAT
ncbi:hypothetical protein PG984_005027 [Apiospora sp. TS-2023a]